MTYCLFFIAKIKIFLIFLLYANYTPLLNRYLKPNPWVVSTWVVSKNQEPNPCAPIAQPTSSLFAKLLPRLASIYEIKVSCTHFVDGVGKSF